ncbi:hypothetical protein D3C87_1939740 [compost metagenome]
MKTSRSDGASHAGMVAGRGRESSRPRPLATMPNGLGVFGSSRGPASPDAAK